MSLLGRIVNLTKHKGLQCFNHLIARPFANLYVPFGCRYHQASVAGLDRDHNDVRNVDMSFPNTDECYLPVHFFPRRAFAALAAIWDHSRVDLRRGAGAMLKGSANVDDRQPVEVTSLVFVQERERLMGPARWVGTEVGRFRARPCGASRRQVAFSARLGPGRLDVGRCVATTGQLSRKSRKGPPLATTGWRAWKGGGA
jgi:hypothetical protein